MHHIKNKPRRFDRFEAEIPNDGLIYEVASIYYKFASDPTATIILLTGRNETARPQTEDWLKKFDITGYEELIMKPRGKSFMPDTESKLEALNYIIDKYGKKPDIVFEDRARVVQMWKDNDVFVINVDQSQFN